MNSIAVIGAGALGLLYGAPLATLLKDKLFFIAEGDRVRRINETVYSINGKEHRFQAFSPDQLGEKPDIVLVAVKNHHLESIVPLLDALLEEGTLVVSVLNGIDSERFIEERFPQAKVLYSVAVGMDAVKEGNSLNYSNPGKLLLGTKNNDSRDGDLNELTALLDTAGIPWDVPEDIIRSLWWKWMINIGMNQVSAVTGAPYGVFHTDKTVQALMEDAMLETVRVAKAEGVDLRDGDVPAWYSIMNKLGPEGKTSMLQDVEARRKTEVEAFAGKLMERAKKHSIPVPVNQTLFRIIKTKELLYLT
ncbi:ketopantoate reductase family protein [Marispirochaeta aestuarii]|uniref:ketopantoate reductase family protein n=1 Tax=Marispirochaeta aestuarii TaxID=1963862 RepID=UPI0029C6A10F|nr:ketopantoate reductase family protein [Marispirochaeta aestuarii]